jgi:hypothetical protein
MLLLGWNFFDLSSNSKKSLMNEIFFLIRYGNFTYSDCLIIPTYERKYFIDKVMQSYEKK